jgi:hypothetical protein
MIEQKKQIDKLAEINADAPMAPRSIVDEPSKAVKEQNDVHRQSVEPKNSQNGNGDKSKHDKNGKSKEEMFANRQSISEVLHDIYDKK